MKVLVTGSTGFIGSTLCASLALHGHSVVGATRVTSGTSGPGVTSGTNETNQPRHLKTHPDANPNSSRPPLHTASYPLISVGHIDAYTDWSPVLSTGIDAVVHLAGKTPSLTDDSSKKACTPSAPTISTSTSAFLHTNTHGTANLARQCARHGVRRFIFLSTIKVLGESRPTPYRADDPAIPVDAYAQSKWDAEQELLDIAAQTGMEVVILRPPLVYGPGVKGNFLALLNSVYRGTPLPLASIQNRRSLVYVGNLASAIEACLMHPNANRKTYLVSDACDVSTPQLITAMAHALQRKPRMLPISPVLMRWAGTLLGKGAAVERLLGSLALDVTPIQNDLQWSPPFSMQEGLAATAQWYLDCASSAR